MTGPVAPDGAGVEVFASGTFRDWVDGLRDPVVRGNVLFQVDRLACGDRDGLEPAEWVVHPARAGVTGWRIHFLRQDGRIVLVGPGRRAVTGRPR